MREGERKRVFPISADEYWARRDVDDKRWETFDRRLDRLENGLNTIITLGKWLLGVASTATAGAIIDILTRGHFQ